MLTTRHACSCWVLTFVMRRVCPTATFDDKAIRAPCTFTTRVFVCSSKEAILGPLSERMDIAMVRITRWLRLRLESDPLWDGIRIPITPQG